MSSKPLFSLDRLRQDIARYFSVVNPIESGVTKIEFEGPRIAIYTRLSLIHISEPTRPY